MAKTSFLLSKWYLDCVADNGDAAMVYVADLKWNALTIHYGSLLTVLGGKIGATSSGRSGVAPQVREETIAVNLPHLQIEGTWQGLRSPIDRTIFESEHGSVDWCCLQPMSQVELLFRGTTRLTGRGYAECLTLSMLPWKLPLHELHWGRFLSDQEGVVWIDCRGPDQTRWVFHNGEECQVQSLTQSEIVFRGPDKRLELDSGLVLRQGRLEDTVFPGVARLARLLPRSMLSVNECKWRSRAVLRRANDERWGWAIHEVVRWNEP